MDNDGITTATFSELVANLRRNTTRDVPQCRPFAPQLREVVLLAGGPSLNWYTHEIRQKAEEAPVICTNGTYNWCLERGIQPNGLVIVDAAPSNLKFISTVVPGCKYLFASQVHPSLFDAVPPEQTWMWHSNGSLAMNAVLDAAYGAGLWHPVVGGCTVTLRAIALLKMLGWRNMSVFGLDSCLMRGEHHAYNQEENDTDQVMTVIENGTAFHCHPWMARQAEDFRLQLAGDKDLSLTIYGMGLIKEIQKAS
jgi:hypothetical protein